MSPSICHLQLGVLKASIHACCRSEVAVTAPDEEYEEERQNPKHWRIILLGDPQNHVQIKQRCLNPKQQPQTATSNSKGNHRRWLVIGEEAQTSPSSRFSRGIHLLEPPNNPKFSLRLQHRYRSRPILVPRLIFGIRSVEKSCKWL